MSTKSAITLVGDNPDDIRFGGVVQLPNGMSVEKVPELYRAYQSEDLTCDFVDWLVQSKGFKEDDSIGFVILFESEPSVQE